MLAALPNLFYTHVEAHNDASNAPLKRPGLPPKSRRRRSALWPSFLPSALVNLGLDLRGGAHLLAEVQVADVYAQRMDVLWPEVRDALRDVRDQVGSVRRNPSPPGTLRVAISNPDGMAVAVEKVKALATPVVSLTGVGQNDLDVTVDGD